MRQLARFKRLRSTGDEPVTRKLDIAIVRMDSLFLDWGFEVTCHVLFFVVQSAHFVFAMEVMDGFCGTFA